MDMEFLDDGNSLVTPPLCVLKGKHFLFNRISNLFPLSFLSLSILIPHWANHLNEKYKEGYKRCRCNVFVILHYVVQEYCLKIYHLDLFRRYYVIPRSAFEAFA